MESDSSPRTPAYLLPAANHQAGSPTGSSAACIATSSGYELYATGLLHRSAAVSADGAGVCMMKWAVLITSRTGEEHAVLVETDENIGGSLASITAIGMALEKLEQTNYNQMVGTVSIRWLHLEA